MNLTQDIFIIFTCSYIMYPLRTMCSCLFRASDTFCVHERNNLEFISELQYLCVDLQLNHLRDAPTGLTFDNCTLCPHCIYVFCIYLRTNSDLCHLQHKLIGLYNRDEKCLQSGTDWVFKYSGLRFVCKGLIFMCFVFI